MKTDQASTKYRRYDAVFKHSAVEHWMFSGKSTRIIAGELGIANIEARRCPATDMEIIYFAEVFGMEAGAFRTKSSG
ncbi:MAG TPA: hypothetical protein VHY30_00870 [Verrucomicrobiae bacterium]|jgi:hypothetical protein|nr:hypothetical protein [Verrucomicrobiae bacterium]